MSEEGDVFPILDRRTPVIERIREARSNGNNDPEESLENRASDIGNLIADIDEVGDEDTLDKVEEVLESGIIDGIAENSEYDKEEISRDYVSNIVDLLMVLELGMYEEEVYSEDEGESEGEDAEEPSFSS